MNKFLSTMLVCCMIFVLGGCGTAKGQEKEKKEQEVQKEVQNVLVCTKEQSGVQLTMTFDAIGDKITKITQEKVIDISGYAEDDIKAMSSAIVGGAAQYQDLEGIEYSAEIVEKTIVETVVISTEGEGLQNAVDEGLLAVGGENADALSLKDTKEALTAAGWKIS